MANTIKLKRSATSGNKLTGSNSTAGELGVNTADKALYIQTGSTDASVVTVYDDATLHLDDANNRVGVGTTSPSVALDVSGDLKVSGTLTNGGQQEFSNSNILRLNQMYTGASTGSYFSDGEYQKVVTITPDSSSQNYQVAGRILVQSGADSQVTRFNATLRSGTLPDLDWEIYSWTEDTGIEFVTPRLWTKETSTAAFIFAFEAHATIYGTVTVDMEILPRSADQKANVSVNTTQNSEQAAVDSGFTQRTFSVVSATRDDDVTFHGNVKVNNAYTLPTSDGSANEFMQTDGSGSVSFVSMSSIVSTAPTDGTGYPVGHVWYVI